MQCDLERCRRLYQTLLLPDFSSVDEVRHAYKSLALKYHPDKNLYDPSAAEKFRDVRVAYEILSNAERKRKYDSNLRLFQPLGLNSFASGARGPRFGFPETGFNPHMTAGTTTSNIYEELRGYAARQAEKGQRRASSKNAHEYRTSQYTKEQQDFFKRREKEHQAEIRRKREQSKREQRERELKALRREQERDEETKKREQQQRASNSARYASSSARLRRASPSCGVNADQHVQGGESCKNQGRVPTAREIFSGVSLFENSRIGVSPRIRRSSVDPSSDKAERIRRSPVDPSSDKAERIRRSSVDPSSDKAERIRRSSVDPSSDKAERIRRERERQSELRRMEQEKYFERLAKQRARESLACESELAEARRQESENQFRLLFLNEVSERQQIILPQEQLERRRLGRNCEQHMHECFLKISLRETVEEEAFCRNNMNHEAKKLYLLLCFCEEEARQRVGCNLSEHLARENLMEMELCRRQMASAKHQRNVKKLFQQKKDDFDALHVREAVDFELILVQKREMERRTQLHVEFSLSIDLLHNALQIFVGHTLLGNAENNQRGRIVREERFLRATMKLEIQETCYRFALHAMELNAILCLIKSRAQERQLGHLADEERARRMERQTSADSIAALRAEIQRLQRVVNSGSFSQHQNGRSTVSVERSLFHNHLPNSEIHAVLRGDVGNLVHGRCCSSARSNHSKSGFSLDDSPCQCSRPGTVSRTPSSPRPLHPSRPTPSSTMSVLAAPLSQREVEATELSASQRSAHFDTKTSGSSQALCYGCGCSSNNTTACSRTNQRTVLPLLDWPSHPRNGCKTAISTQEYQSKHKLSSARSGSR